ISSFRRRSNRRGSDDPVAHVTPFPLAVLAHEVGEGGPVDDVGDRLAHPAPEPEEVALAVELALLVARLAHAIDRRDRSVDVPHDLADRELVGRPSQAIAPFRPAPALDESPSFELT